MRGDNGVIDKDLEVNPSHCAPTVLLLCIRCKAKGKLTWNVALLQCQRTNNRELQITPRQNYKQFQYNFYNIRLCESLKCSTFQQSFTAIAYALLVFWSSSYTVISLQHSSHNFTKIGIIPNLSMKAPPSNKPFTIPFAYPKKLFLIIKPPPSNSSLLR